MLRGEPAHRTGAAPSVLPTIPAPTVLFGGLLLVYAADLPDDCILEIARFLPARSLAALGRSSRLLQQLFNMVHN